MYYYSLGDCSCTGKLEDVRFGKLESEFCLQCNTAAIFYQYATFIYPVLSAMTVEELDTYAFGADTYDDIGYRAVTKRWWKVKGDGAEQDNKSAGRSSPCTGSWGRLTGAGSINNPVTGIDRYKKRAHDWGKLLTHTYHSGGSQKVISDYCKYETTCCLYYSIVTYINWGFPYAVHLIVDHSAVLCDIQGPLGFWSQQGFEAAHKILKTNYSRATQHGGGKYILDEDGFRTAKSSSPGVSKCRLRY